MNRKEFLSLSGLGLAAASLTSRAGAESPHATAPAPVRTGNGDWTYETVPGWGELPATEKLGPTHGGFAWDKAGNLYVNTDGPSGTLVFGPDGKFLKSIAREFTGIHAMNIAQEADGEYIYAAWLVGNAVLKLKLDGTLVKKIETPAAGGAQPEKKWKPTTAVVGPDGRVYVCDGYGDSRIHIFNRDLEWQSAFGSYGKNDGQFRSSHGLSLDTRGKEPRLMVCDRENWRLSHYDLDGKFVGHRTQYLRRPCQVSFSKNFAVVSEIHGRVTILDEHDVPVAFLGDNPDRKAWDNYTIAPEQRRDGFFNATHGVIFGPDQSIYVTEWSKFGRLCKLQRVKA